MTPKRKVRVLLVESAATEAGRIQQLLDDGPGEFAVYWARTMEGSLERMARSHCEVILLDSSLPAESELEPFARLREAAPATPVIVLLAAEDEALSLRMVRAGAEDCLPKSGLEARSLARAILYAVERAQRRRGRRERAETRGPRGRLLALLGAKGGVGTTTTALNLGAALAATGRTTVVAELRSHFGTLRELTSRLTPHGNLSSLLALEPGAIRPAEVNARLTRASSELGLLYGPQTAAERGELPPPHARAIAATLARAASFAVLDLPAEPSTANREAIRECDFLGLVVDREKASVAAARAQLQALRSWGVSALTGLIVTQRTPLACPFDLDQLTADLGLEITELIPPAPDACAMAAQAGVPVFEAYQETLLASSFSDLASKLSAEPLLIRKSA